MNLKNLTNKAQLGSKTAKNGFKNEDFVVDTFNDWQYNLLAQEWLETMGYKINNILNVKAQKISGGYKADVQVLVRVVLKDLHDVQNIQVKLVSNLDSGFNQIDKRWLKNYQEMWNIPDDIMELLQYFVGEKAPKIMNSKDNRRMFFNEFTQKEQDRILKFFRINQALILCDILKGRGKFASEWFLVILTNKNDQKVQEWVLKAINEVINFYSGEVKFSPRGSLYIGKVTMQRKGGDAGRQSANMLQFKIDPCKLFEIK